MIWRKWITPLWLCKGTYCQVVGIRSRTSIDMNMEKYLGGLFPYFVVYTQYHHALLHRSLSLSVSHQVALKSATNSNILKWTVGLPHWWNTSSRYSCFERGRKRNKLNQLNLSQITPGVQLNQFQDLKAIRKYSHTPNNILDQADANCLTFQHETRQVLCWLPNLALLFMIFTQSSVGFRFTNLKSSNYHCARP